MAKYRVRVARTAQKTLDKIQPVATRRRIETKIAALATNPRPSDCTKLTARDAYRVRVGDYRIVYSVADDVRIVSIEDIGHRREIYR